MTEPTIEPTTDGISGLKKMSTTAGLGDDYAAVDPLAIAAFAIGVASLVVLLAAWAFPLPAVGLLLAVASLLRIRRAGGTLTGLPLAGVAAVLCLVLAGVGAASAWTGASRESADADQIERLAGDLAAAFEADDFAAAYALFHPGFREAVPPERFADIWRGLERARGETTGIRTSGRYQIERGLGGAGGGSDLASTQLLIDNADATTLRVSQTLLIRTPEGWRVRTMPEVYPMAGGPQDDGQ